MLPESSLLTLLQLMVLACGVFGRNYDKAMFPLTIIHMNDFHARFEQTSVESATCTPGTEDRCVGGIARISTAVKNLVKTRPNAVFLNGGDNFQGTIWYSKFKWNVTAHLMNMLPHDALTIGNHEFDGGIAGLVPFLENVKAPFIACNIDATDEPTMQGKFKKSVVIERGGKKIGIIGYVVHSYPELSTSGKLKFLDEVQSVRAEVEKLKAQGINIIIGLSHAGLDVDREVAAAVRDIDVIVGGHSHSFLYTGTPPSIEVPMDSYPVIVRQPGGRSVLVVQAYAFSKYVGNITVWFDSSGEFVEWAGKPVLLDKSVPEDPEIVEALKPWAKAIHSEGDRVIGSTKVFLDATEDVCVKKECNIGKLFADALVNEYVKTAPEGSWTRAAIGILNGGGIRSSIEETRPGGNITYGDLLATAPFSNTVDTVELKGKHLLEVLEFSVSRPFFRFRGNGGHKKKVERKEFIAEGFLQFSGIQVAFNTSKPKMERVDSVTIRCADCRVPVYEPLNKEKWYRVALFSYLATGNDGYTMITDNARNRHIGRVDIDVLVDYISKQSPITTGIDGNIVFL